MDDAVADEYRMRANQAAGMVSAEADCSIDKAFDLIFERANGSGRSLEEIIGGVLDRSIRFD